MWLRTLLFHELVHLLIVFSLSCFIFWKFRSKKLILIAFAVTFLIDLDHIFDYFYFAKSLNFWPYLGKMDFFVTSGKVFVLTHSWELVIFLAAWGIRKHSPTVLVITLALIGHLLVDQLSYTSNPLAYFLIFRVLNNFSLTWFNSL